jgi:serine/threonine protein kinase
VSRSEENTTSLSEEHGRDLRAAIDQLHKELQAGALTVDLGRFLPPPKAPHRRAILGELVKNQMEARFRHRRGCLLEHYLRLYPELGQVEALLVSLIYTEYQCRTMFGDGPALQEYRERFPQQFTQLQLLVRSQSPHRTTSGTQHSTIRPDLLPSHDALPPRPPSDASRKPSPVSKSQPMENQASEILLGGQGYELLERIGKGEYGEVFRALAPGGIPVAVKRLFRPVEDVLSQKELKVLERIRELRHPYLLQMHNFQAIDQRLTIVMELADGSLKDRDQECRAAGLPGIPVEELLHYFTEAAEALDFLHQEKLTHRDIKPQNLLHLKGHAKVADFGIARTQVHTVEHTMNPGGTPAYMAPEVWGGVISVHSDQYSLAITWYEMRTASLPFPGKSMLEAFRQHVQDPPGLSEVPEPEQQVLLKALAKKPLERFDSCTQFVQALTAALAPPGTPVPAQSLGVKVLLAFVLVAVLLAVVLSLIPRPSTETTENKPATTERETNKDKPPIKPDEKDKLPTLPPGWEPDSTETYKDEFNGRLYYKRLKREFGGHSVVMVLVWKEGPKDPETFYIMENKVSNDLYATFMEHPKALDLFHHHSDGPGFPPDLVAFPVKRRLADWKKGGLAQKFNANAKVGPFLGVAGEWQGKKKESFPVFRVRVTEAHCFAEWLGGQARGRLPTVQEWRRAAGKGKDKRDGPFDPACAPKDLGVGLENDGPLPVTWCEGHVSIFGCRQMAGNGLEWTCDIYGLDKEKIPFEHMNGVPDVLILGRSYLDKHPFTFQDMQPLPQRCTDSHYEIGFRVVLQP